MPTIFKWTNFFSQGNQGWSESVFLFDPIGLLNSQQVYNNYQGKFLAYRAALMGENTTLVGSRVSALIPQGQSYLAFVNFGGVFGEASTPASTALDVVFENPAYRTKKHIFLRGFWQSLITAGGTFNPTQVNWAPAFQAWRNYMIQTMGVGWYGITSNAKAFISNITFTTAELVSITVGAPIFPTGSVNSKQRLRVAGVNGKSTLNGTDVYYITSTTTCQSVKPKAAAPWSFGGTVAFPTYNFIPVTAINSEVITSRKAGRPFFLERGRAPIRPRT